MSVIMGFVATAAFATVAANCPLTAQEQIVADYVKKRNDRVSTGAIAEEISQGSYTQDSLQNDMYEWWVQLGLVDESTAIEQFVNLMQDAKQVAEKKNWLSVVIGWIGVLVDCLSPEFDLLKIANAALEQGLETWRTAAEAAESKEGDFFSAAMSFRSALPTKMTKQLTAVDNFIDAIRQASDPKAALLQAYSQVTRLIAKTNSLRKSFNQYYLSFVKGASVNYGGNSFDYLINHEGQHGVAWTVTPKGLDPCTVADFVHTLNLGYVSPQTPGLEDMDLRVMIPIPDKYPDGNTYGLRYSCSSDADLDQVTDCYYFGWKPEWKNGSACDKLKEEVKSWEPNWPKNQTWPTEGVKEFCSRGIVPSTTYMASHYSQDGVGFSYSKTCSDGRRRRRSEAGAAVQNANLDLLLV